MAVSAVILTRDEEHNLPTALDSVDWCDEVIIVDSKSLDGTRKIATEWGATVIDAPRTQLSNPYDHFRALGVGAASNELVLLLDADESLPTDLQEYLQSRLSEFTTDIQLIRAPVLNYLGDELLIRGWPRFKPIVVRGEEIAFERDVHDFLRVGGVPVNSVDRERVHDVPAKHELSVHHELADSVYDRLRSQRRYARIASKQRQFSINMLIFAPLWGFYRRVFHERGWRDGLVGVGLGLCYSWFLFETQLRAGLRTVLEH